MIEIYLSLDRNNCKFLLSYLGRNYLVGLGIVESKLFSKTQEKKQQASNISLLFFV